MREKWAHLEKGRTAWHLCMMAGGREERVRADRGGSCDLEGGRTTSQPRDKELRADRGGSMTLSSCAWTMLHGDAQEVVDVNPKVRSRV